MRVALHSQIRSHAIAEYRRRHAVVPPELATTLVRVGISDWSIWRSGTALFHVVDCEDWDAALEELAVDQVNLGWQAEIGALVEMFRDQEGEPGLAPLELVWRLASQRVNAE